MTIYFPDDQRPKWPTPIVALGNFDGVHRGHQKLLERVKRSAVEQGGTAVALTFEPHPSLVLRPVIQTPTMAVAPPASSNAPALSGSSWRLEDLAGTPAVSGVDATIDFIAGDRVAGNASCNRFTGTVKVSGTSIAFGPLASTRMACMSEPANAQETAYLKALSEAERFVLEGTSLQIFSKGQANPLKFARKP